MSPSHARSADHQINEIFLQRWSPRAFDASVLDEAQLLILFEAARWAPSAFNAQPWRFVYALRETPEWKGLLSALVPSNAEWAQHASALVVILSQTWLVPKGTSGAQPATTNSFDAGAAWALMALQATHLGLSVHAMAGFDPKRAAEQIGSTDHFKIEAVVAVGRRGNPANLSEALQQREQPSLRLPVSQTSFRGRLDQ